MDVSLMPTEVLQRELIKPTGAFPAYLAMAELQKRVAMKNQGDASKAQGPTVAQQLVGQPTAYADGGSVRSYQGGVFNPDGTPNVQRGMSPGGYWQGILPWLLGQENSKGGTPRKDWNQRDEGPAFMRWFGGAGGASEAAVAGEPPVSDSYRDEGRNYPFVPQPTKEDARKADQPPVPPEGKGSSSVRAGIGAYAPGAAPDLSRFAMPTMGTPAAVARPDFASIRAGMTLPDRTGKVSEGIAGLEERLGQREKGNLSNALMQFGLGALASKSPWTAVGAGEAGLGALKDYRAAQSEQDKARFELLKAQGDIARMQGEGDRAGLQAATQNFGTAMRSADSEANNNAQLTAAQYQGAVQGRNTDVNAATQMYGIGEATKARMQAAALSAQARGDQKEQDTLFKYMRYIEDAEKRADASLATDAKTMLLMETNPNAFELLRAQRREAARQEVLMKMPVEMQQQFSMNMSAAGGGQPGIVSAPPPNARIRQ